MSNIPIDQNLYENYRSILQNLLNNYPPAKDDFDNCLKKTYYQHLDIYDAYLKQVESDFLNFLDVKYNRSALIIKDLESILDLETKKNHVSSEFEKFLEDVQSLLSEIMITKTDMEKSFSLYVIGAGKAGKSTLINALVGTEVASVGVLPKTWKVDRFFKDNSKQAIIHYNDGSLSSSVSQEEATKIVQEEEDKRKASEKNILKQRREYYALNPNLTLEEKEGFSRDLNNLYLYRSNISQVEWSIDVSNQKSSILHKFSIIDTPGVGQNHAGTESIKHVGEDVTAFSQADGMIWVIDATTLAAAKPKALLEEFEESSAGITTKYKIAVLNRIDSVRDKLGEQSVEKIILEAQNILGEYFTAIIALSAKQAYNSIINSDDEALKQSGYDELVDLINDVFSNESSNRIYQKADRLHKTLCYKFDRDLEPYLVRLKNDEELLKKTTALLEVEIDNLKDSLNIVRDNFIDNYQAKVQLNINDRAVQYLELTTDAQRNEFLSEYIFEIDVMQSSLNELITEYQNYVADFVAGHIKSISKKFKRFKYLDESYYPMMVSLGNKNANTLSMNASDISFTSEDETSMLIGGGLALAGMAILGPVGLLVGAADVLFGWSKGRKVNAAKQKFTTHLNETILVSITEQIDTTFEALVAGADLQINKSLEKAFSQLHFIPNTENFRYVKQCSKNLRTQLQEVYVNPIVAPKKPVRLKPSLTLYLLRQK